MPATEPKTAYTFGSFRLSPETRRLDGADGRSIPLRGKGFELLWYLIQHAGRLVEKDELMQAIWPGMVVEENNLSQTVSALRQALGDDAKQPKYLATIKGRGYQFIGDVQPVSASEDSVVPERPRRHAISLLAVILAVVAVGGIFLLQADRRENPPPPVTSIVERFADARLELLTDNPGFHSQPALSAAGRMIAYVSDTDGTPQIWIRHFAHGEPIQITHGAHAADSPSWTSDDRVLYEQAGVGSRSIYSVGILGDTEPKLVVDFGLSPHHAQRADAFVYTTGRSIWIARNNGRDRQQVSGIPVSQGFAEREPALSPDGTQIAFIHADEGPLGNVWLISANGGEARQLTNVDKDGGIASSPAWSADGRYIVYSVDAASASGHLWRVNIETGESEALTVGPGGAKEAAVSGDGTRMAYTSARPLWRLTRINPETRESSLLFESRTGIILPVSSADRRTIVFFSRDSTGMQLFTVGTDGANLRQLTFDKPGENALPTWHGDGESILYYRGRSLYRLDPSDGSDTQVFEDFHWSSKNWLDAHGDRVAYHKINRPTGEQHTVIRGFGEDNEVELPVPIEALQWSSDGQEILGFFRRTGEIFICRVGTLTCSNVYENGAPVIGTRTMWSPDNRQIYFIRVLPEDMHATLWRVDRDGTNREKIADMPIDFANSAYDFTADGSLFYNHVDRSSNEVWLATVDTTENER